MTNAAHGNTSPRAVRPSQECRSVASGGFELGRFVLSANHRDSQWHGMACDMPCCIDGAARHVTGRLRCAVVKVAGVSLRLRLTHVMTRTVSR